MATFGPTSWCWCSKKRQKTVDFAKQRGIYALYDDNFRLIYVGQVGRGQRTLYQRLRSHSRNNLAERWSRFSWFGILEVSDKINGEHRGLIDSGDELLKVKRTDVLNHLEAVVIMAAEPIRNAKGGIFGAGVTHYRQYRGAIDEADIGDMEEDE